MKLITLDQVYDMYCERKSYGFYRLSAKGRGVHFGVYCDILKNKGYMIY